MSEPKLTVGRVETWRPIDGDAVLERAGLALLLSSKELRSSQVKAAVHAISAAINERMAELFPPAPPQPAPEAKAEPDYTCPKCGAEACPHSWSDRLVYANARIAELMRERDEARAELREIYDAEPVLVAERHKVWEKAKDDGFREGYRKGVAAAKEACARRLVCTEDGVIVGCSRSFHVGVRYASTIVRETEVPGP